MSNKCFDALKYIIKQHIKINRTRISMTATLYFFIKNIYKRYIIHAIIFSDKSGTMGFIFRDLHPFSGTDHPPRPPNFFFSIAGRRYIPLCRNPMVQNREKSYYSTDDVIFLIFVLFNISVKLHDFVCRPRRVAAEILIQIKKHIYPRIYDFPYILPQIKPTI